MGRLTKDPELRYTASSNIPRCTFSIAVDRRFARQGEEKQTDFFNIVAWRNQAEFCSKYFTKGLRVLVVGSLQNRSWDDNEGKKHYITEVVVDEVYFADSRRSEGGPAYGQAGTSGFVPATAAGTDEDAGFFQTDDDDLPF
jgi:single-strand DNA-binding protein